jgi:hypothetical protein
MAETRGPVALRTPMEITRLGRSHLRVEKETVTLAVIVIVCMCDVVIVWLLLGG